GSIIKKYHETGEVDMNEAYSYRIEGMGKNLIPSATKFEYIDQFIKVTDEDAALSARELTFKEALFMGYTSGAVIQALKELNKNSTLTADNSVVIIVVCDRSRYNRKMYNDGWMKIEGFNISNNFVDTDLIIIK